MLRIEGIRIVLQHAGEKPIVGNLGPTSDELQSLGHRDRNFYTYGSMGLCSSIALGMALSTDQQVISLDGDGSLLMNMGTIATIGRESPPNLIVVVWDNEEWCQTGHQPSHTATSTDLESVAKSCGISQTATVTSEEQFETILKSALDQPGPWFIVAKIDEEGQHIEAAPTEPELTLHRFRQSFELSSTNPHTQPWHKPSED
ncbi:sulfopyruvate decarboxylase subunit beta [SAR202 cluster bacterium AD-804-J14_MRT_500m]|nr:sulfopyruvate decarboxylase subunit beta [SAR202 cluster bacterium AD-804-J14_MRT_500m]